jgi:peptidyl-prolyl cis-trans isomerase SurA
MNPIVLHSHRNPVWRYGLRALAAGFFYTLILIEPTCGQASEIVDRIVAIVNDEVISLYELNQAVIPYAQKVKSSQYPPDVEREILFEVRNQVLNELISQKLADQELKKQDISVSAKEVDGTIERLKESRRITDEELRKALADEGISYEEYRDQTKQQLLRARLVNREVRSKIVITEQDIRDYYDKNISEYTGEKKYHLRNMFIRISSLASDAERQSARRSMETILDELKAGKPFREAEESATGSSHRVEGGDLGEFSLEDLSPQLRDAVKNLADGEFTPVIEETFGYQIVYVEKVVESKNKSMAEVYSEIEDKLFNQIIDERYQTWLQGLRDRSHIKIIN